jgi:hypothetical protein
MTDNENDESFFSLLTSDSDIMFTNPVKPGESSLDNVFADILADLDQEEEGNMNDNPSCAAMPTDKGKEESSGDRSGESSSSSDEEQGKEESSGDQSGESSSDEEPAPEINKK